MRLKWKKLGIELIIISILLYVISFISLEKNIIEIPEKNNMVDFQFNIVTVVTVFAGFSFSVLGLLISLSSTEAMIKLRETNILSSACNVITNSIIFFLLSFFISLFYILGINNFIEQKVTQFSKRMSEQYSYLEQIFFLFGIFFMIIGILLFALSVYKMVILMNYIFVDNQKNVGKKVNAYKQAVEQFKTEVKENNDFEEDYEKDCFKQ